MEKTYKLKRDQLGNPLGITCLVCGAISSNASDIKNKYCRNCNQFHSIMMEAKHLKDKESE